MFPFRKPSRYAVAIRESMEKEPEKWTRDIDILNNGKIRVWMKHCEVVFLPSTWADRRTIRAGVEAWVAWSVARREPTP